MDTTQYNPSQLEAMWQEQWEKERLYEVDFRSAQKPFYTHVMFPYPSGDKLHVGHWYNFAPSDTFARFKMMQGYDVFSPIGFDAFGLPAENYAVGIRKLVDEYEAAAGKLEFEPTEKSTLATVNGWMKHRSQPANSTRSNVRTMIKQLKRMGCMYDWTKLLNTSEPEYYRWTQWVFLQMFKRGLAEQKTSVVNWDPVDQTVLANEQVKPDGTAERSGAKVEKRPLKQWFFKIKDYAEPLLQELPALDWPEKTKIMQKNWIGRSEGVNFRMKLKDLGDTIEVYDSIPQTYLAQTFTVIAPEHELVERLIAGTPQEGAVRKFLEDLKRQRAEAKPASQVELSMQIMGLVSGLGGKDCEPSKAAAEISQLAQLLAETTAPDYSVIYKSFKNICAAAGLQESVEDRRIRIAATQLMESKIASEVDGIFTGRYVENPFGTGDFPIWIASYALAEYGTGIVNCSAHDERDFAFAKKFGIPLRIALLPSDAGLAEAVKSFQTFYREVDGLLTAPVELAGQRWDAVRQPVIDYIEKRGVGFRNVNYRLRDWCVSRQRYWGAPIPIAYDPQGKAHAIPDEHLPWTLPTDVDFKPDGVPPLARSRELAERVEKIFGPGWRPETDTMDTFVCSSFYSFRYLAQGDQKTFLAPDVAKKWMPVDVYIGGAEHATKHLLYARFIAKALNDAGHLPVREPYKRLIHQGLITKDGHKMSKSHGNAVSPDPFVERYGADVFRMYLMFLGPFAEGGDWSDQGIKGVNDLARHIFEFFTDSTKTSAEKTDPKLQKSLAKAVKKIGQNLEQLQFNTCISTLMELRNEFRKAGAMSRSDAEVFIQLTAPFAPHLAEQIWRNSFQKAKSIFLSGWPVYDENAIKEANVEIPVQVNGKLRGRVTIAVGCDEATVKDLALAADGVSRFVTDTSKITKVVYVPNRMINFIVAG